MEVRPVLIDQIVISERVRKDLGDIADLANDITARDLIQPIVISDDFELQDGYRRLEACRLLGWTHISARFYSDLNPFERLELEINANVKRKAFEWEELAKAYQDYHYQRVREHGKEWTLEDTARRFNISYTAMQRYVQAAREMDNPLVQKATSIHTAANQARRIEVRREADKVYTKPHGGKVYTSTIIQADFNEWAPTYTGPKFNLLHCDFPYGINAHKSEGQNSALDVDYTDSPETFWTLFKTLSVHLDNFCAESAHIFFWFSPNIYCDVWNALKLLAGFKFEEHPLIWMRGENEGIAPDPNRRPRRVYETCFFGWRGDRPIIKTKANIVQAPTTRKDHPHEKSELALRHFFEMCVDNGTRLLDPTCGSGSALRAARDLGGNELLGLEANPEYAAAAQRAFTNSGSRSGPEPSLSDVMEQRGEAGQILDGHGGDTHRQQTAS